MPPAIVDGAAELREVVDGHEATLVMPERRTDDGTTRPRAHFEVDLTGLQTTSGQVQHRQLVLGRHTPSRLDDTGESAIAKT